MTPRFRALAVKAGVVSAEYNGFDANELSASQRKFAELIVQECAQVLWNMDSGELHDEYVESLKKHFGIK
jgi:hypothetical protein